MADESKPWWRRLDGAAPRRGPLSAVELGELRQATDGRLRWTMGPGAVLLVAIVVERLVPLAAFALWALLAAFGVGVVRNVMGLWDKADLSPVWDLRVRLRLDSATGRGERTMRRVHSRLVVGWLWIIPGTWGMLRAVVALTR